jgi:hypothetical protein
MTPALAAKIARNRSFDSLRSLRMKAAMVGHTEFPQGLKPLVFMDLFGTTEVVP